ncbi:hypothetical protein B9Z55_014124 [Caenorhabditis nigoni]|uniref:Uncharacterized protein n=1 Tax=Caenorhabditis nigoni TaxID=1611254 RepID=A0A2G5U5H5_9PELO|nr:hypothetical protein B9Z55_014124 [Caenorhabditis nigoni]
MVETENLIATKKESKNEEPSRHQFKTWYEYFFSVNNLCIGLTNFIIFPAKVHEYRGGAFLVAYFCMLIVIGYPVLYLELIIGQYHRSSPMLFIRRCAPILQGFGWLSLVSAILILFPYQYSVARAFKFVVSLSRPRSKLRMPWSTCDNRWNTKDCYQFFDEKCPDLKSGHIVFKEICVNETGLPTKGIYSAEEQYLHSVVHKSVKSHMSFSNFDSGMACSIFIIWLSIAYIQLRAGNKTTPLIYVPTVIIFLICPFFFFRALHLDGATIGIVEMIRVEWAELLYSQLWIDALNLVIQSLRIGIGGHTVMAPMAQPQRQTFYVASLAVLLDTILSLVIAGTLFSILGHISHSIGRDSVYDLTVLPPRLIITHSTWPVLLRQVAHNAWLWVLFYYIAILVVGWKFCALVLKTISVSIADVFLFSTRSHFYNYFTIGVSIVMASFGLILCYDGGSTYIPMVEDVQKVATGLFITAEVVTVLEFYGLKIFYGDIHSLMGNPSDFQWSHAYTWSFWKWRWRMAPVAGLGLRGDEPSLLASRDCYATLGSFRCDGSKQCLVHNVFIDTRWATKIPEGYSIS